MTNPSDPVFNRAPRCAGKLWRLLSILVFLASGPAQTHGQVVKDYDLKAVFLYNFAQFVDWPASAFQGIDSPLVICVLGSDPFGGSLDELTRNEVIGTHPLKVRRHRQVEAAGDCHILFIDKSETDRLDYILSNLRDRPVLTVSETEEFAARGGMIRFLTKDNKIRLAINQDAAKSANLALSSKLLKAAQNVVETGIRP